MKGLPMLVLSRMTNERIMIGDNIVITVIDIRGDRVRLGIDAPIELDVDREEIAVLKRRDGRKGGRP